MKLPYHILFDYGAYEGNKFADEEFATLSEAVEFAQKLNYSTQFRIVQIIPWRAKISQNKGRKDKKTK